MSSLKFETNPDHDLLVCPLCESSTYVHLDDVYVAGRPREDGPVVPVHVDAAGRVRSGSEVELPGSDLGRRHTISLRGRCEHCGGHFVIQFKQHKGETQVQLLRPSWRPV